MMIVIFLGLLLVYESKAAVNLTGCIYNEPWPYVFDASELPTGDIHTPGFREGVPYPEHMFCDYVVKAPPGYVIKITFKEMELEAAGYCSKDKIYVNDGATEDTPDLGAYCGSEPPPYPVVSTQNAMFIRFRTDHMVGKKGVHIRYEAVRPSEICPSNYRKCRNNNCFSAIQKCDGKDDCGDGTDEEACGRPLPIVPCGSGRILPFDNTDSPDRVVGGIAARPGSWPWQADLQKKLFYPDSHVCGGTLIHPQWVMTAAHCLGSMARKEFWKIYLGNHDKFFKEPHEQVRYVDTLVMYPGHVDEEIIGKQIDFTHDIALMKLNAPVEISDYVRPACLPSEGYQLPERTKCIASGWGWTRGTGYDKELKQAEMYTQPSNKCFNMNDQTMICVKSERGLQDVCHGDSGGPLNCKIGDKWHVLGITSFGSTSNFFTGFCAVSGYGTVFNKVSAKVSWINDIIKRLT